MSIRRIYTLLLVLGLAMVWLGFLFTYELKITDRSTSSVEQIMGELQDNKQFVGEDLQIAGFGGSDAMMETSQGFPLLLSGLGVVFVLGGVFSYRSHKNS